MERWTNKWAKLPLKHGERTPLPCQYRSLWSKNGRLVINFPIWKSIAVVAARSRAWQHHHCQSQIFTQQRKKQQTWIQLQHLELRINKTRTLFSCFQLAEAGKWTDLITNPPQVKQGSAPTTICPTSIDESVQHDRRGRFNIPRYRRHAGIHGTMTTKHRKKEQKPGLRLKTELRYRPLKRLQPALMLRWYADDLRKCR